MFWKSLQLKLILVFSMLILSIMLIIGSFSLYKIEEVYYTGFIYEMQNSFKNYNFKLDSNNRYDLYADIYGPHPKKLLSIDEFYKNFNTYFSLTQNNGIRNGIILNSDYIDVVTGKPYEVNDKLDECINNAQHSQNGYAVCNDKESSNYYFAFSIASDSFEDGKAIIVVTQNKTYINRQLNQIIVMYAIAMVGVLIITLFITTITSRSITKPIALLTNKAEMMAQGDISMVSLNDKESVGYEISKLIDTFNIMMEQIQNNLNDISSEKNKLETILMHLTDGVLAFNMEGRLIHANYAAKNMLEIEKERSFNEIFGKYNLETNLEKIIYLDEWTTTDQFISIKDKFLNVYFAPFRNERDKPIGAIVILHDTTKQTKLDNMRKEFVSNVSHELKTPLTSVKTYAETLLDQEDLDSERKNKFLNVILTESNRMSKLVSDLLQLTKFDYNKIAWEKINFDITELTKQICEKHKIQADKKNQMLECHVTSNVPEVFGDRDGIEQAITNIISNSIKYTPEGGNIKVYIGAVHDDAYIKIIDNGIGIPQEDLPRVFERFYRVDKARSREMGGTGLGLPIAKEIIDANNGSINMNSEVGKGTEVIIKIPTYKK